MTIYLILLAVILLLAIPLEIKNPTKIKKAIYIGIIFILFYLISALRYDIGSDYYNYIRIFDRVKAAPFDKIFTLNLEPVFVLLTKLISMITDSADVMYAIYAALILIPVAVMIYRHSDRAWLSIAAFYCLTLFSVSLNFIRQSLATSVLLLAYGFMKKRKIVPVLIMGIIATLIHYTAIVFIVFYLLSFIKMSKKYMIIYGSISVGVFVIYTVMTAVGASPIELVAKAATAIFGKDYAAYANSIWFTGLGPQYLLMPLILLAITLVSYFCGWKERPEADMLLHLNFFNATIWLFIVHAFIIERFTMFIFVFNIFAIPSICSYFSDKAAEAAKNEKTDKKTPGYSKKNAEEKRDNSFLITAGITTGMVIYCCFGLIRNFHTIVPYAFNIPELQDAFDGYDGIDDNRWITLNSPNLYGYLIGLRNADCDFIMLSTGTYFTGITPGIIRADKYAGTDIAALMNDPQAARDAVYFTSADRSRKQSWNGSCTTENGVSIEYGPEAVTVTDKNGQIAKIKYNKLAFILLESDGTMFDGTAYNLADYTVDYENDPFKVTIEAPKAKA